LFGLEFTGEYSYGEQSVRFGVSVNNLFNTRYRDYMNRLRYYSDELGRNIVFRITVPLSFHTAAHDHEH
jgi:iron complex outermembrane receptor protein